MALVKQTLADALEIAFSRENSAKDAAEAIATAIDSYVKAAVVSTTVVGRARRDLLLARVQELFRSCS